MNQNSNSSILPKSIATSSKSLPRTPLKKSITPLKRTKNTSSPYKRKGHSPLDNKDSQMEYNDSENNLNSSSQKVFDNSGENPSSSSSKLKSCLSVINTSSNRATIKPSITSTSHSNFIKTAKKVSFSDQVSYDVEQRDEFIENDALLYDSWIESALAKLNATEIALNKETKELLASIIYLWFGLSILSTLNKNSIPSRILNSKTSRSRWNFLSSRVK